MASPNGHEFEQTPGSEEMMKDREAWHAKSPWGRKESDTTKRLNNNRSQINITNKEDLT